MIGKYRIMAYPFRDVATGEQAYWRDVGTLDAFWQANMELVEVSPELNLYDNVWPILTYQAQRPPAKFVFNRDDRRGVAVDSMVSGGCIVSGAAVSNTVLFTGVKVRSYSHIDKSVVLPEAEIGRHCRISRAIIDRGAKVPDNTVIGQDLDADRERGFRVTEGNVVLVTPEMLDQPLHFTR